MPATVPDSPSATQRLPIAVIVTFAAAALALIGSFLPWVSILVFHVNGTDGDGVITAIASAAAIALLASTFRLKQRLLLLTSLASIALAITAFIYLWDSAQLSRVVGGKSTEFLGGMIRPGAGLVIGAISAPLAFLLSITLVQQARAKQSIRVASERWGAREVAMLACSSVALSFVAFADWWGATIVLGVIAGTTWFVLNRPRTVAPLMLTIGLVMPGTAIVGAVLEGALGGSSSSSSSCSSIFKDGASTADAITHDSCQDHGKFTFLFTESTSCKDGSTLRSNDYGWGYESGTWHSGDSAVLPIGTCNGLAADRCADAFAPGTITEEAWNEGTPQCIGSDGKPTYVFMLSWSCWNSEKKYLRNDYGWGYIGEQWQAGEPPSDC